MIKNIPFLFWANRNIWKNYSLQCVNIRELFSTHTYHKQKMEFLGIEDLMLHSIQTTSRDDHVVLIHKNLLITQRWSLTLKCFLILQLDLQLQDESGGDISSFITNGEWELLGKYPHRYLTYSLLLIISSLKILILMIASIRKDLFWVHIASTSSASITQWCDVDDNCRIHLANLKIYFFGYFLIWFEISRLAKWNCHLISNFK